MSTNTAGRGTVGAGAFFTAFARSSTNPAVALLNGTTFERDDTLALACRSQMARFLTMPTKPFLVWRRVGMALKAKVGNELLLHATNSNEFPNQGDMGKGESEKTNGQRDMKKEPQLQDSLKAPLHVEVLLGGDHLD